jgi:RimJ/RimL family protein N-acetyltransferase
VKGGGVTTVEDFLEHHGVKGMHWGVRKNDAGATGKTPKGEIVLTEKLKGGESISIYKKPPPALARFFSKYSDSYKKDAAAFAAFSMHDKDGKKVGDAAFVRQSKDSLYLEWIGIKAQHRGKGYASAALRGVVKYAQDEGIKKLTLEVPTNAPDARHIYEKLGFKGGKAIVDKNDPVFGGLTPMSLDVPQKKVSHAQADDTWEEDFANEFAAFLSKHFSNQPVMKHMDAVEDILAHYGVKGMHWGQRKKNNPASTDSASATKTKTAAKKQGLHTVSNAELQAAIRRMQLEQDFKRLKVNEQAPIKRWVASTLLEIGKREVQQRAAKKIASTVIKKAATGGVA